jgi:hypothetical protein
MTSTLTARKGKSTMTSQHSPIDQRQKSIDAQHSLAWMLRYMDTYMKNHPNKEARLNCAEIVLSKAFADVVELLPASLQHDAKKLLEFRNRCWQEFICQKRKIGRKQDETI